MVKRKKQAEEGAPLWVVTYGDMMSLLLCFFIILVAMSEVKKDETFRKVMESIKEAFGYAGGIGTVPADDAPENSMIAQLETVTVKNLDTLVGESPDEGMEGRSTTVRKIREGLEFTLGGLTAFEDAGALLLPEAKSELDWISNHIVGLNTKLEIRGHTAREAIVMDSSTYQDDWDLSYARAREVAEYLKGRGIRMERVRLTACGASEPIKVQAYDTKSKASNRRVEIIVTESLVQEFTGISENDEGGI